MSDGSVPSCSEPSAQQILRADHFAEAGFEVGAALSRGDVDAVLVCEFVCALRSVARPVRRVSIREMAEARGAEIGGEDFDFTPYEASMILLSSFSLRFSSSPMLQHA